MGNDDSSSCWAEIKKGSPVAMSVFRRGLYSMEPGTSQIDLFYFDDDDKLRHWFIGSNAQPPGQTGGDLNKLDFLRAPNAPLAAYWPYIYFQNSLNQLQQVALESSSPGTASWTNQTFTALSSDSGVNMGRVLAVIPSTDKIETVSIFHLDADKNLVEWIRSINGTSWKNQGLPIIPSSSIAPNTNIAAFAIPPVAHTSNSLTNILLYQDPITAKIQMLYRAQSPTSFWSSPRTYAAFENADNGTHIACVTAVTWTTLKLEDERDGSVGMRRCFFQVGGAVREVEMVRKENDVSIDAVDWRIVGWVGWE